MSFDLYFLDRRPDESWDDAMDRLEEASDTDVELDEVQLAQWGRIKVSVGEVLPAAQEFVGANSRELSDDRTGIQLSWFANELSLTVPYWHAGDDADRVVALLEQMARAVEEITGLVAYDPQAGEPFLVAGAGHASGTFDQVAQSFGREVVRAGKAGFWKRLLGRG